MAVEHLTALAVTMTIEEGVEYLRPTGHPVTSKQLAHWLTNAKTWRERVGRTDYYRFADIVELHRDWVDGLSAV